MPEGMCELTLSTLRPKNWKVDPTFVTSKKIAIKENRGRWHNCNDGETQSLQPLSFCNDARLVAAGALSILHKSCFQCHFLAPFSWETCWLYLSLHWESSIILIHILGKFFVIWHRHNHYLDLETGYQSMIGVKASFFFAYSWTCVQGLHNHCLLHRYNSAQFSLIPK